VAGAAPIARGILPHRPLHLETIVETLSLRSVRFGDRRYPLVLPSVRDPRLHLASVVISIHVLGQVALGFHVSIVQILAAILTCAVIEIVWTFHQSRSFVWPASAMLTGSSVALILRVIGTEHGDYWSWRGWYVFAAVAGISLVTKYVIRYQGSHVFNPSNVGLVAAFLVLGSSRVEPLDFWWTPLDAGMVAAYLIILVGGLLITARLRLLAMSVAFWAALAAGIGVVAASGHCMVARWSFAPVCGAHFWWVIVTSPEILIFLFFMITDPKTVPSGRVARVAFGAGVALLAALLVAPQGTEFGAKVAVLGSLVILCAARPLLDRLFRVQDESEDRLGRYLARLTMQGDRVAEPRRAFARGAVLGVATVALVTGMVVAGIPAREATEATAVEVVPPVAAEVDPSTLPTVTVSAAVGEAGGGLTEAGAREVGLHLAENLETEARALLDRDADLLVAVDFGGRLVELREAVEAAMSSDEIVVAHYRFNALRAASVTRPPGQGALRLAVEGRGTLEEITYDAYGDELERTTSRFEATFLLSRPTGDRWLLEGVRPGVAGG
jgi:hypothetical protein